MATTFDVETRWPELFDGLTAPQRRAVINTLASSWHEGWTPNRPDVEDLTLFVSGAIDEAEYDRRTESRARPAARVLGKL